MRHNVAQKKLGRSTPHRRAMLRNITTDFFRHEQVNTTLAKARALKPVAEKLITLAKKDTLPARRKAYGYLFDKKIVHKLFTDIAPRYKSRPGGYTRLFKTGIRVGDASQMALLTLVGKD